MPTYKLQKLMFQSSLDIHSNGNLPFDSETDLEVSEAGRWEDET